MLQPLTLQCYFIYFGILKPFEIPKAIVSNFKCFGFFGGTVGSCRLIRAIKVKIDQMIFCVPHTGYRMVSDDTKQKQMMHTKTILIRADTINSLGSAPMLTIVVAKCFSFI